MKDGISLSLKDYAILRKIKDYTAFPFPKPLHCSLSLPKFSFLLSLLSNILLLYYEECCWLYKDRCIALIAPYKPKIQLPPCFCNSKQSTCKAKMQPSRYAHLHQLLYCTSAKGFFFSFLGFVFDVGVCCQVKTIILFKIL